MDISSPNPTLNAATAVAGARPAVVVNQADLPTRLARFDELSGTVLDTSGNASEHQQLAAYQSLQTMQATGQLIGIEDDRRKVLDQATYDSDIGRRAQQLSKDFYTAVKAAGQSEDGASGALQAALSKFDGLSTSDQSVLFATTLNAPDRAGVRPYADPQAWRDNTEAQQQVVDYMQSAGVVGANGRLDHRAAATKAGDAKFASALKLSLRADNNSPEWTRDVQALFGAKRGADRVELSAAARKYISEAPAASSGATTPTTAPETPYVAGAIVSRTV